MAENSGTLYVLQLIPPAIIALDPDGGHQRIVIDDFENTPDGLQIDADEAVLIWTNMGSHDGLDFKKHDGTIERINLDGTKHETLVHAGYAGTPKQIQLDRRNGHLYWCDREGMRVLRSDLNGDNVTVLVQNGKYPDDSHDIIRWCVGIAIDVDHNHLYWSQKGPDSAGKGRIFRASLDLPKGQEPSSRNDIITLIDHLPEPIDLAIDHENGFLYWTDRGHLEGGNSLNRARLTKNGLSGHEILASGLQDGIGLSLDLANNRVFIADLGGNVWVHDLAKPKLSPLTLLAKLGPLTGIEYA